MQHTTQQTIDRWVASGRRFVPARPGTATHRTRDTSRLYQEVTHTNHRAGLYYAARGWMRRAHADTPVEQTEKQLAAAARVCRRPR